MGDSSRGGHSAYSHPHSECDGACLTRADIAAARIVAYDFPERSPVERAQMLARIGLTRIIWDWREEHTMRFGEEIAALESHGISVEGLWCPMPLADRGAPNADAGLGVVDPHVRIYVEEMRKRGLTPDLWTCVEFGQEGTPAVLSEGMQRARVRRVADHLEPLARLAQGADMCVALTNHLGWFGEPHNLVDVIEELAERGLRNVGIAYQMQHGHSHAQDFDALFAVMQPHLVAVALSGMDADAIQTGRKILPWGAGRLDRRLAHTLMASGWHGLIAVQGHSADDAEARLLDSIEGMEWMLDRWQGVRHERPTPRIETPAWPEPAGVAGPYMGMAKMSRALRRRLEESGAAAPTLSRVRTSPEAPEPIHLRRARKGRKPTGEGAALSPEDRLAQSGGATRAFAAIQKARADTPPEGEVFNDKPMPKRKPKSQRKPRNRATKPERQESTPLPASASASVEGTSQPYEPADTTPVSGVREAQLPLRIAHRDVSHDAPDPDTGALHALLTHLEEVGFRGAPRSFGWDSQGRHLVEWVDGIRADAVQAPAEALDPQRIGEFMREMHDALESFRPPRDAQWFDGVPSPGGDLIIHQDIGPSNLVVCSDGRLVAIDWDAAAPGTRLWDIAHTLHVLAPLHSRGFEIAFAASRVREFARGYRLSEKQREELIPLLAQRPARMFDYLEHMRATGESPWLELWDRGAGAMWQADSHWIAQHEAEWRLALLG